MSIFKKKIPPPLVVTDGDILIMADGSAYLVRRTHLQRLQIKQIGQK